MTVLEMNRGLFRIWIVIAVCWCAALIGIHLGAIDSFLAPSPDAGSFRRAYLVGSFTSEVHVPKKGTAAEQRYLDGEVGVVVCGVAGYSRDGRWIDAKPTSPYPPNPECEWQTVWPDRQRAVAIILGPPMALFLLGAALLWAIGGFRRNATNDRRK